MLSVYAVLMAVPMASPLRTMPYAFMPTLSVDASHDKSTVLPLFMVHVRLPGIDGAVVSTPAGVTNVTVLLCSDKFPLASIAFTE